MMKVVKNWNSLAREVVNAPCLETFKVRCSGQPDLVEDPAPEDPPCSLQGN